MKKVILAAAVVTGLATVSFAGNPKGETKEAKAEVATSEVKQEESFTYYVTGQTSTNYTLSTTPAPQCGIGSTYPCQIESENALASSVPKSTVDSNPTVDVVTRRGSL